MPGAGEARRGEFLHLGQWRCLHVHRSRVPWSRVTRSRVMEDPQELEEFEPEQVLAC